MGLDAGGFPKVETPFFNVLNCFFMPECYSPRTVQLMKPIFRTGEILGYVQVPCGKCANCIKRRRMELCFRMEEEMKVSKNSLFVTLTYDPKSVPFDKFGNMVLVKTSLDSKKLHRKIKGLSDVKDKYLRKMNMKDSGWIDNSLQGFLKRMRVNHERTKHITREAFYNGLLPTDKCKFFACGEYGDKFLRPHMHLIVFNCSEYAVRSAWEFGDVHIAKATKETVAYCTKYMDKWKDKKQSWKKPIEFNVQSNGLGLGFVYRMVNWYRRNLDVNFVVNESGVKIPMPRFYRLKFFNDDELSLSLGIINDAMRDIREEDIRLIGLDKYNDRKKKLKKESERKFKRGTNDREF